MSLRVMVLAVACTLAAGCSGAPGGPANLNKIDPPPTQVTTEQDPVVSSDILAREPVANNAQVKHILIGWSDSSDENHRDPRATKRSKKEAEELIKQLMKQLQDGADFDAMMKQYSEDPGSAGNARAYPVSPDASLVIEFKQLGLRLKINEIGVVQSEYGFHIMKRVE
jgi:PPIC-type PPIASE domain